MKLGGGKTMNLDELLDILYPKCFKCQFEDDENEGMTIYFPVDWDGGIGFDYGEAIYCPDCGRPITSKAKYATIERIHKLCDYILSNKDSVSE